MKRGVKNMKTKSLMTSFAILLVAMSTVGFAYSGWTDQVKVEGVAHMGEFIVGILTDPIPQWQFYPDTVHIIEATNGWYEDGTGAPAPPAPGSFVPKPWVANTTVELSDYRTSVHHEPTQTVAHKMDINVVNAYPQYGAHIVFLMKNAGTIPAHIRLLFDYVTVEGDQDPVRDLVVVENGWVYSGGSYHNSGFIYDPRLDANVIKWWLQFEVPLSQDPDAVQLEPCNHYMSVIVFAFTQDAQECHTYKFGMTIDAIQWNMDWEWDLP
jgi:hypothetical protein